MKNIYDDLSGIKPLFIIGVPRSGTTILHQIVNAHPEVFISDELRMVSWLIKEARKIEAGFEVNGDPYPFNHGKEFSRYLLNNAGSIFAPFYYLNSENYGKEALKYWGDKYPHYDEVLPQMVHMFPRAKYVMIHRDLRDVMASVQSGHQWEIEKAASYVCKIYKRYIDIVYGFSSDVIFHIHYEELLRNPAKSAKKIYGFLNIKYDDTLIEKVQEISSIQSHSVRKMAGKGIAFNKSSATGKWKHHFSSGDIELINKHLEENMITLERAKKLYSVTKA